jgi:hypothetical protein
MALRRSGRLSVIIVIDERSATMIVLKFKRSSHLAAHSKRESLSYFK